MQDIFSGVKNLDFVCAWYKKAWAKNKIKEIGYELVSYESEPYEKKGFFHFGRK